MKKTIYLAISLSILSNNSQLIIASENSNAQNSNVSSKTNPQQNINSQDCKSNTDQSITQNTSQNSNPEINSDTNPEIKTENVSSNNSDNVDELDALSLAGEKAGIEITAPSQPGFLMNCLRKVGVALFLMPYIRVVNGYRNTKNFIAKISTKTWNYVVGKNNTQAKKA